MTISVGDAIPDVTIMTPGADGPEEISTAKALGSGTVVLFAVPGAFTPGCSKIHLPSYVAKGDELKAKGVDTIACVAVNDAFVMDAWAKDQGASDILMLADGNGEFTKALGLELDVSGVGLGTRSKRYAMVLKDGVVQSLDIDESGIEATTCDAILEKV